MGAGFLFIAVHLTHSGHSGPDGWAGVLDDNGNEGVIRANDAAPLIPEYMDTIQTTTNPYQWCGCVRDVTR